MISGSAGSTAHSAGCCSQKGTHAAKAGADWVAASRGAAAAEVSDAQMSATSAKYRRASDIVFPAEGGGCSSRVPLQACSRGCPAQDLQAWRFAFDALEIAWNLQCARITPPAEGSGQ